jgi:hypothetical protein
MRSQGTASAAKKRGHGARLLGRTLYEYMTRPIASLAERSRRRFVTKPSVREPRSLTMPGSGKKTGIELMRQRRQWLVRAASEASVDLRGRNQTGQREAHQSRRPAAPHIHLMTPSSAMTCQPRMRTTSLMCLTSAK